jgi:Protein of unknown function (DUF3916)
MTVRRLSMSNKKLRGIPRRLRAISRWSARFAEYFPAEVCWAEPYWNWKIPVNQSLVQGGQTSVEIQRHCAQCLIDAAFRIFQAKCKLVASCRVTCVVILPHMFSSELCIYFSQDYFDEQTQSGEGIFGRLEKIDDWSLASSWGLSIPAGFRELGVRRFQDDDDGNECASECWYFGEIENQPVN